MIRPSNFISLILVTNLCGLGYYIYDLKYSYQPELNIEKISSSTVFKASKSSGLSDVKSSQPSSLSPRGSYAKIISRPLFSSTRRVPSPIQLPVKQPEKKIIAAAVPVPKMIEKRDFKLAGVVIEDQNRIALIRDGMRSKIERIKQGDIVSGWTVEAIETESVQFRQGDVIHVVLLRDNVLSKGQTRKFGRDARKVKRTRNRSSVTRRIGKRNSLKKSMTRNVKGWRNRKTRSRNNGRNGRNSFLRRK